MERVWLIAEQQFRHEVLKKSFLIALVSLPLFMAVTIGLGALGAKLATDTKLGYVDAAGFIRQLPETSASKGVELVAFDSRQAAQAALENNQVDAYFVVPMGYPAEPKIELVYAKAPRWETTQVFDRALRLNLLAGQDPQVVARVLAGPTVDVEAIEQGRTFGASGPTASDALPVIFAFVLGGLILTISSTLMEALVAERENRVIEVMVTSVSTGRMMAGKILGVLGMGAVLLAAWLGMLVVALWLGGSVLDVSWMQGIEVNWRDLAWLGLVMLPSLLFASALMVIIGTMLADTQDTQQIGALFAIFYFAPIYLIIVFAQHPNGPVSLGFSLFPMTSVTTLAMRSIFVEVPTTQFLAAAAVGIVGGLLLVWLAGRTLRANMLRYGQELRLGRARKVAQP